MVSTYFVIWLVVAVVIDFFLDPAWVNLNNSIYGVAYFAAWNISTQVMYLHVLPFAISNAIEAIGAAVLAGLGGL